MPAGGPWPGWLRYTASALAGAAVVFFAFRDVQHAAQRATEGIADHESRIRTLESQQADIRALKERVDELRTDVKTLLQRTAPK